MIKYIKSSIPLFFLVLAITNTFGQGRVLPLNRVKPTIVRILPHDKEAFTQGLVYYKGELLESTGLYGKSTLRRIDITTGSTKEIIPLADLFGEGLTTLNNKAIQLTWKSGYAFIYHFPNLTMKGHFRYQGEGWGLTTLGNNFLMSNGSDTLYVRDSTFSIVRTMAVQSAGKKVTWLNELECARGKVYANVLNHDHVFEIDPASGNVLRAIDCQALVAQATGGNQQQVLNGIAYSKETDLFYLTGKNWPFLFEVRIP